jgi:hypothetical protein
MLGHRLVGVLDQVEQHDLQLVLVGPHERARGEVGDDADVVLLELVALSSSTRRA